jgi:hypothetical protein
MSNEPVQPRVECPVCFGAARVDGDGSLKLHAIPFNWDSKTVPTSAYCTNTDRSIDE